MTKIRNKTGKYAPSDADGKEGSGRQAAPAATEQLQLQGQTTQRPEGRTTPEGETPLGTPSTLLPQTTPSTSHGDDGVYENATRDADDGRESESRRNTRVVSKGPIEAGGVAMNVTE